MTTLTTPPTASPEDGATPAPGRALRTLAQQARPAVVLLLAATLGLGLVYPAAIWAVGRLVPGRADGSLVRVDGTVVGSALVGQVVEGPGFFFPRPSAAGEGYDALASAGSNLGPESADLLAAVEQRRAEVAAREGVDPALVPPDAVTASASGLDPHISPQYAAIQVPRVARERGLPEAVVRRLVAEHTQGRQLGVLGEERVNVVTLDAALRALRP